jgi:hypothetical protein
LQKQHYDTEGKTEITAELVKAPRTFTATLSASGPSIFAVSHYIITMLNTPDRSCEVEIGKSSFQNESLLETRVKNTIDSLLGDSDPFFLPLEKIDEQAPIVMQIEQKCQVLERYFKKVAESEKCRTGIINEESFVKTGLSNKRRILLKFTDNSKEDEVFNRELGEIPEKLREEIQHCKQVLSNLLNKEKKVARSKLLGYIELLHECSLLKIHSDPVCLFIQDEESKSTFEDIIKLTCVANTYKTFLLRAFLALEKEDDRELLGVKTDLHKYETVLI